MADRLTVTHTSSRASLEPPGHWIGNPPTQFRNPWPSFREKHSLGSIWRTRFGPNRNFVPVPEDRKELVNIRKPDWGIGRHCMKATWIGHAGFLVETTPAVPTNEEDVKKKVGVSDAKEKRRGLRILLDPVFCERMGPMGVVGPKRFSPPPCPLEDVPEVDAVCISHNHYDHLDVDTVKQLYFDNKRSKPLHFFCGLNTKKWFVSCGIREEDVTELDWWDEIEAEAKGVGKAKLVCTPSQHASRRGAWDDNQMLWCSWVIEEVDTPPNRKLFFAGDTGYLTISGDDIASNKDVSTLPSCPAFAEIGKKYGPFDLALLPIGCYTPRTFMSSIHCAPEDSIKIHREIRSKKSLGMHYGTVRGGLSAQYEDVRDPPKRWREAAEKVGLQWGQEILLCDIGETVVVD